MSIAFCVEGLGILFFVNQDPIKAVHYWGMAEALREASHIPLQFIYREECERIVASSRLLLGEEAFTTAWAQGRAMMPEQAFAAREPQVMPGKISPVTPSIPPTTPAPSYPAGLTAREVEVLRLVAQGLSNAQIAEQLVISPYTVNAHMRSIYNKLEVNSRIAVVQFATKHHLV